MRVLCNNFILSITPCLLAGVCYILEKYNYMKSFFEQITTERPKSKTNEEYRQNFLTSIRSIVEQVNQEYDTTLLSEDGTVSMKQFGYTKEELEEDKKKMKDKENGWLRRDMGLNPDSEISKELREEWLRNQAKKAMNKKSDLAELVATVLFHKVLGKDYIIARASKYDDYFGFDNIIVHKKTGTVVCTFDDVHDRKDGSTIQEKKREVVKSAQKGGATIKYGFTFRNNQLVKEKIEHVPKLYMAFDMKELDQALETVQPSNLQSVSEAEYKVYNRMIENFEEQIDILKNNSRDIKLLENIEKFAHLLPELKR